ncbi:integrase, catalytic region, zinc finger, CCHC-type containing protein, partial [Tanacetum coccineum]
MRTSKYEESNASAFEDPTLQARNPVKENGPYVRRMIHEPDDPNSVPPIEESIHKQTNEELTKKEAKQMEAGDQEIQTILIGSDIGVQEKKAKLFNERERFTSTDGESIESYYHCGGITNQNVNQNGNGNVVAVRAEGNGNENNGNHIRCYNCRGFSHYARNCTIRPRRRDATHIQTQLLIAQKEEARIQLQAEEFDLMAAAGDIDKIEEVNANCILMGNLQQATTS